jgi:hypothetical protein
MVDLFRIIVDVSASSLLIIVLFSFSWALIYCSLSGSLRLIERLFIVFPYDYKLRFWHRRLGKGRFKKRFSAEETIDVKLAETISRDIEKRIGLLDKKLSGVAKRKSGVLRILFPRERLFRLTNKIMEDKTTSLEKEQAFFAMLAGDLQERERGFLNYVGNPLVSSSELKDMLFYSMKIGPDDIRDKALFHIASRVNRLSDHEDSKMANFS